MNELEKNEVLGDLYAYYGPLLTKGQQEYFEDYYYNDLSLGEIADNHHVSRQAVYDNLKRSSKALEKYEAKLQMRQDYHFLAENLHQLANLIAAGKQETAQKEIQRILTKLGE